MVETGGSARLEARLEACGADLRRWPEPEAAAARERLLRDRDFRQHFDEARRLDSLLHAERSDMDKRIAASGAMARLRGIRAPSRVFGLGRHWRRIAAGVLVAGLLGGTFDSLLTERAQTQVVVLVDPLLYGPDETDLR